MEKQEKNIQDKPLDDSLPNKNMDNDEITAQTEEVVDDNLPNENIATEHKDNDSKEAIDNLNKKIDELQDKLLRQLAESENIRVRSNKMVDEAREYAIFSFAKDLIPVMDNFQRALNHIPDNLSVEMKNIIEGMKMTKNELDSVFKKHHLESIGAKKGEKFDYNVHHAISQKETNEFPVGNIVDKMQDGYKIKNRLIRPAAVVVAKKTEN